MPKQCGKRSVKKPSSKVKRWQNRTLWVACAVVLIGVAISCWAWQRQQQHVAAKPTWLHGFDVSRHQGQIDWQKIDTQRYHFVFIKATEGGDYQDPFFRQNWQAARQRGLATGAYHFFRNCTDGKIQADNFIHTVPRQNRSLPPVIDLEFQWDCPQVTAEQLQQRIAITAQRLQHHYGQTPILYVTPNYYQAYIADHPQLSKYPIWRQDTQNSPNAARHWLFWQYSHKGKIHGIAGRVDLNVFHGSVQQLQQLQQTTEQSERHAQDKPHE